MRTLAHAVLTLAALAGFAASFSESLRAQAAGANSGTIRGSVLDQSGAAIIGATVEVRNPVSGYSQKTQTGADGAFELDNVPFNPYHVRVTSPGFEASETDLEVKASVPLELMPISMKIGAAKETVEVVEAGDLIETDPVTHTDVDRALFDKLPVSGTSSLTALVTLASPGVSGDSNGLMHGMGDHASNSFSVDGQPITDQQSKIFSNQISSDSVQSMEVIEGAPPAEYGDKTSLVIVVTTRSGLGSTVPHGDFTSSFGSFGTYNEAGDFSYGGKSWGNFISVNGMDTGRFLDTPEFQVMHDHGNQGNLFDRIDYKPSTADTVTLNLGYTRSWFQTPNSYDAQDAAAWSGPACPYLGFSTTCNGLGPNGQVVGPQDQRSKIRTYNVAPSYTHLLNTNTVLTVGGFARQDQYNYYPSRDPFSDFTPDLQLETIGQNRRLTNLGGRANVSYVKGAHNLKIGVNYSNTILTENDSLGIVDPNFAVTPLLACYDLALTAVPASDHCPVPGGSGTLLIPSLYTFNGHADIRETSLYIQDTISVRNWSFNVGLRGDIYKGLASANQAEPRLGISYNLKPTRTVLRVSYARTLETPFNENLVLSSLGCDDAVIKAIMSTLGPCNTAPLGPGWRNEFHAGLQQVFGRFFVLDGEYIWKYTHKAYDFSILGNTPITFPVEWASSKIPGYAIRGTMPGFHGLTAYVVMSSVAARFFTPQVAGIGAVPGGSTVFRIDHDEKFNQTTHFQYQPKKTLPWLSVNWRYDSGQVAGAAPCAGGNCANGPNGTDSIIDVSALSPDQQYQAGLFCGSVHATPTTPISANGLCPASEYGSKYLSIPAPGTENDDHNPPRIASRNLFDVGVGDDNLFHGDKHRWSARFTVVNITDKEALYNFLSTFSGTHYVTPRSVDATIGYHF